MSEADEPSAGSAQVTDSVAWTGPIEPRDPLPPVYRPPSVQMEDAATFSRLFAVIGAFVGAEVVFALVTGTVHLRYGVVPMSESVPGFWLHVGFLILLFAGIVYVAVASWFAGRKKPPA